MISSKDYTALKLKTLEHFWDHQSFRDGQEDIINAVINGEDTLALLPTGGGKSLCYQLPALLLEGTCIVISPLLALMKDQVYQLKNRGIEAEYLSAELDDVIAEDIYSRCKEGITKLLYISPERLTNIVFLQNIEEIAISFIAVDEAHCISEWGQDFRPSYQNIKTFRAQYKKTTCLALTATATPKVLKEIIDKLDLKNAKVFQKSFRRNNINIYSEKISDKYQRIYELLKNNTNSGIIYTRTRKEAEHLTEFLKSKNINQVDYYHAGLTTKEKNTKQKNWIEKDNYTLISTNAFGMGIDKENVRFVIHLSPPPSVENYYQEIGRAGRDGAESFAFLFWNDYEISNIQDILKNQIPNQTEYRNIINYLYSIFQIAENDLPENTFQLSIQKIQNFTKLSAAKIKNVLNFLHTQEVVFINQNKSLSTIELLIKPEEIDLLSKKESYLLELLLRNIDGFSTHKTFFSEINIEKKIGTELSLLKQSLQQLQQKKYINYIDGALSSIKFLQHRNERTLHGKYWNLFVQIQKNKLQKWEEMKFYIKNEDYCKMRLILSYFGEKNVENCDICDICEGKKQQNNGKNNSQKIISVLQMKPSTLEEIAVKLPFIKKENILEYLMMLLDLGKIKMIDYKTYTVKN